MGHSGIVRNVPLGYGLGIALALLFSFASAAFAADSFPGKFTGPNTSVTVEKGKAGGSYTGVIQLRDQKFPFQAKGAGDTLTGTFEFNGSKFSFTAQVEGDVMAFKTGSKAIPLKRVKPKVANPFDTTPKGPANPFDTKTPATAPKAPVQPVVHPLQGKWESEFELMVISGKQITIIDKEEPTDKITGTFKVTGNQITATINGESDSVKYEIKGNTLTLIDSDGARDSYTRVGAAPPVPAKSNTPATTPTAPAKSNTTTATKGFAGNFSGKIQNIESTAVLQVNGTQMTGSITAVTGYTYKVAGTISGNAAEGKLSDLKTGGQVSFKASISGDVLKIQLVAVNPATGQQIQLPAYVFNRKRSTTTKSKTNATQPDKNSNATDSNTERDARLVGRWRYTETQTSGNFTLALDTHLIVNADGTYLYGQTKGGAGGAAGSILSKDGSDVIKGQWRTQNKIVYVKQDGTQQWQAYARYTVDSTRMLFQFGDGSKRFWNKY